MKSLFLAAAIAAAAPGVLAKCKSNPKSNPSSAPVVRVQYSNTTLSTVTGTGAPVVSASPGPYKASDSGAGAAVLPQVSVRPTSTGVPTYKSGSGGSGGSGGSYAAGTASGAAAAITATPTISSVAVTGNGGTTCTVTAAAQVAAAVASCTNILLDNLSMPPSSTLDLQGLQPSAVVIFSGTTEFGYTEDADFDPIVVSGDYVTVTGADGHVIDGNGQAYWDGQGSNGGSDKPDHFFVVKKSSHMTIANLNIQNWPTHLFSMSGNQYLTVQNLLLNNTAGDAPNSKSGTKAAAHNSDGFDISSSDYVTLSGITVYNQDDCVAVTSGTHITVSGLYCSGGHGLSIGSIGGKSNNTVDTVVFEDSEVVDSLNGVRIKSNSGTTGSVSNIVYRNIKMSGITSYGLDVQQDYLNGGPTGTPTNGVTITGITFDNVQGTVTGDEAYDYYILCGTGSCSDFTFTNVSITGGKESCNYPSTTCPSSA